MITAEKLLAELIALPSVNPAFLPEGDARAGESRVADFLAELARGLSLSVEFQKVFPQRSNVIIRLSPPGEVRQRILLAPHMDTVGSVNMPEEHFRPVREDGRMHGRGACDTKGSIAALFSAMAAVARDGRRPRQTEIVFVGLVDEENAQKGSRALAASGFKADLAIVGEPTELQVVTAHKGDMWLKLVSHGRAAHGARPELGVNAVHEMAKVIDLLETKYAAALRERKHPLLGHPTINVGSVRGGTQPNIVPARCEIEIDRRTIPGEKDEEVQREILHVIKEAGLQAELINSKDALCLPMETDPATPLVRRLMEQANQTAPLGVDFFCDAAILSGAGIPCVVFGPGDIAQAHTADEWISLKSLEAAAELLVRFFRSLP